MIPMVHLCQHKSLRQHKWGPPTVLLINVKPRSYLFLHLPNVMLVLGH